MSRSQYTADSTKAEGGKFKTDTSNQTNLPSIRKNVLG